MKFNKNRLNKLVEDGFVNFQTHPHLPLKIYKYSMETTMSRNWNNYTLNLRGTVLEENDYNQISYPFPKFFNFQELETLGIEIPREKYRIFEKMDGSLISIFRYNGEIVVASSGSFTSPHAIIAEGLLKTLYVHLLKEIRDEYTYLFELIHPDNQIVVDYGNEKKLVLLGVIRNDGTENFDILDIMQSKGFDVVREYSNMTLQDVIKEIFSDKFENREGFVVQYENGFRIKFKYDEYFKIHKLVSGLNEKFIWEFLYDGTEIPIENIPDEFLDFVFDTKYNLQVKFESIFDTAVNNYNRILSSLPDNYTQKDFALKVNEVNPTYLRSILFAFHGGYVDNAIKFIWKLLKPKFEKGYSGFSSYKGDI